METCLIFSGTFAILFTSLIGTSLGLECIICEWTVGQENKTSCLTTPFKEKKEICSQPFENIESVCETTVVYKMVQNQHYLTRVSRKCQLEHSKCDNHCNPETGVDCFTCCNANNNCNSLPLSSLVLPPNLEYNITNTAAHEASSSVVSFFGIVLTLIFM